MGGKEERGEGTSKYDILGLVFASMTKMTFELSRLVLCFLHFLSHFLFLFLSRILFLTVPISTLGRMNIIVTYSKIAKSHTMAMMDHCNRTTF